LEPSAFARLASKAAMAETDTTVQTEWEAAGPSP